MQGPNDQPVQRIEVLKNTRSESTTHIGGNSRVYDSAGRCHNVEELFNDSSKFASEPLHIFSLNETTLRMDQVRIKTIIKQSEKKAMLRFSTINGSIDLSKDREVMVNRDGALVWITASSIVKGDLLITPKIFRRDIKNISWKDALTVPYDYLKEDKKFNSPSTLVAKVGDEVHEIGLPEGFCLRRIHYLVGLLDACGWIDPEKSGVHLRTPDMHTAGIFCGIMSSLFLVEPEMTGNKSAGFCVDFKNRIVADLLSYALNNLFSQEDEYIGFYLSGFFDGSGKFVDDYRGQSAIFFSSNDAQRQRLKKALHVFSVLAVRQTKTCLAIDYFEDIESLAVVTDFRLVPNQEAIAKIMVREVGKDNTHVGYSLGSMLSRDRQMFRVTKSDFGIPVSAITRYEKGAMVPYGKAWMIAETINDHINPTDHLAAPGMNVPHLVASDIIGIKVTDIQDIGEQVAFEIECEGSRSFFASDVLCRR